MNLLHVYEHIEMKIEANDCPQTAELYGHQICELYMVLEDIKINGCTPENDNADDTENKRNS